MTSVILTGTGGPEASASRAQAGTLVETSGRLLQFDAGRGTVMRLTQVGIPLPDLAAVFITHHHSDHVLDLADLVHTRWLYRGSTLEIVVPEGPGRAFCERVLEPLADDIRSRLVFQGRDDFPEVKVSAFHAADAPAVVWKDEGLLVSSVRVHHGNLQPAVAYRVKTSDGVIVISGDTRVCTEMESLAADADVLVHSVLRNIGDRTGRPEIHADSVELGAMAQRIGVRRLVLTHLLPPPRSDADVDAFVRDARSGGFEGEVVIGPDLTRVDLESR
ncbi:MAG: MBL fold metallo-hydrolase [Actinomycetota bacterium]